MEGVKEGRQAVFLWGHFTTVLDKVFVTFATVSSAISRLNPNRINSREIQLFLCLGFWVICLEVVLA